MSSGFTKIKDIEQLEADYRAGVPSVASVARSHGISTGHLGRIARKRGWKRDLSARVKARAKAKVTVRLSPKKEAVKKQKRKDVAKTEKYNKSLAKKKNAEDGSWPGQTDEEIVEMAAEVQAAAILRFRGHVDTLVEYTMEAAKGAKLAAEDTPKMKMDLPGVLAQSVSSLSRLYSTFRSAYGIDEGSKLGKNLDDLTDDDLRERILTIAEGVR